MKSLTLCLIVSLLLPSYSYADETGLITKKTYDYVLETSDVENFWEAYDAVKDAMDKEKNFKELYLDRASEMFIEQIKMSGEMRNANNYLKSFSKYPKYWESLREPTLEMKNISNEIDSSFNRVQEIYPDFKPGDVLIFISPMIIGGSIHEGDIVLGAELNVKLDEVDLSEFDEDISYIFQNDIKSKIIHETIHLQQKSEGETLLGHVIHEGSADFLAELFLKQQYRNPTYTFGLKHEEELWLEFSKEMHLPDYSKWLYGSSKTESRPMDLGYFVGYMITKSYYEKSTDKKKAVTEIIEVSDFEEFLALSGYGTQFANNE